MFDMNFTSTGELFVIPTPRSRDRRGTAASWLVADVRCVTQSTAVLCYGLVGNNLQVRIQMCRLCYKQLHVSATYCGHLQGGVLWKNITLTFCNIPPKKHAAGYAVYNAMYLRTCIYNAMYLRTCIRTCWLFLVRNRQCFVKNNLKLTAVSPGRSKL
jgi:hypothetical protein